ncbi:uncharacterized protein LOC143033686 [Oratosquilla oratoria]|uniref:uncharacterized protein LOC143033686 n=1 Tax=Oratosquilla oratoria TaxID=337810 RepID=UPI003F7603AA
MIIFYKKKGDRANCGNSRGISLLAVADKSVAKILLSQLTDKITETNFPESQCGFRKHRSTTDMLTHAALGRDAGISIQHRLDGSLFNNRRLHARTKVSSTQIIELQYADDSAIVAHDAEDLQNILDVFSSTYAAMGLRVNSLKKEILVQTILPPETPHLFLVNGEPVKTVEHFTYLGSVVHSDCSVDLDIQRRINLASTAFGRLRDRVFSKNNLRIDIKAAVYKAVSPTDTRYIMEGQNDTELKPAALKPS